VNETRVIADFGSRGVAVVDEQDYEALKGNRYRLDCYGTVVRSLNRYPGDKGSRTLSRDVGDLMGLPADRLVGARDGSSLNATRANLVAGKAKGGYTGPRAQRSQPPGVHRVKARSGRLREAQGLSSVPPDGYVIYYHSRPCMPRYPQFPGRDCMLHGTGFYLGTASRVSALTVSGRPKPAGWEMLTARGGRRTFENYFDGVEWLLECHRARTAA
jgi:hypothetical protein